MTYLLDGRPLQGPSSVRGIGSYVAGLLGGFAELGVSHQVDLLLAAGVPPPSLAGWPGASIAPVRIPVLQATLQQLADPVLVAWAVRRFRPGLYHATEFGQPLSSPAPVVVTVHDLIPFLFPDDYPWVRRSRLPGLRLLRRANAVITVSAATARDVQRVAGVDPSRITVIHNGISAAFTPAPADEVAAACRRLGITGRFLLAVGTFDPRKRVGLLADVFHRVRAEAPITLVIAGDQGAFTARVSNAFAETAAGDSVRIIGHVDDATLAALYTGAECLVFTSAYEGFGLPPVEAMACGTAAVVFDNSSLPEVAGAAAITVPDGDAGAMAAAIVRLLHEPAERVRRSDQRRAWASQFTWRRAAEATLTVYDRVLPPVQRRPV